MNFISKAIIGTTIVLGGGSSIYGSYLLVTKKTIRDKLLGNGYKVLDVESSSDPDNSKWKEKVGKWDEMNDFINNKDSSINTDDLKIKKIKEECKKILDIEGSEENYKHAQDYCAVKEPETLTTTRV